LTVALTLALLAGAPASTSLDQVARSPRVVQARASQGTAVEQLFKDQGLPYPAPRLYLRAFKREGQLELWAGAAHGTMTRVHTFAICARSGDLGPKRKRGDLQVPEGFYRISQLNPTSSYHLSLRVDYPNRADRARGDAKDPGGDIFIHGDCVTIGCVPIQDEPIEQLFLAVLDTRRRHGTPVTVHLFPARMDAAGMRWLQEQAAQRPELLAFWEELRPAYEAFERDHRIPATRVDPRTGRYLVEAAR